MLDSYFYAVQASSETLRSGKVQARDAVPSEITFSAPGEFEGAKASGFELLSLKAEGEDEEDSDRALKLLAKMERSSIVANALAAEVAFAPQITTGSKQAVSAVGS